MLVVSGRSRELAHPHLVWHRGTVAQPKMPGPVLTAAVAQCSCCQSAPGSLFSQVLECGSASKRVHILNTHGLET